MNKPRFLMSAADHFGVEYIINPWMEGNIHNVNRELAKKQWNELYQIMKKHAEVDLVSPQSKMPDLVFTANAAFVLNKNVILAHFRHPERQSEEAVYREWFLKNGYEIYELPKDIYFEGAGDALIHPGNKILWLASGFRSDEKAKEYIEEIIDAKIISLKLIDSRFYHLDTCLCPLENGYLLYFPLAFDRESQEKIRDAIPEEKLIPVSEEDALKFACNAVSIYDHEKNKGVIIMNAASDVLRKKLESKGFKVITTPTSEFMKSGGSTKCLTLRLL